MSSADERVPPQVDTSKPSIARVYDASLGGKDNFEADREMLRQIIEVAPEFPIGNQQNRAWLARVVRFLAGPAGIDQIVDCGSGLPTADNTHQIAQRINRETRVVYADNDPAVVAYGRALLEDNDRTHFVAADLTRPEELLGHPEVRSFLDLDRPLGLIQCATLHSAPDDVDTHAVMATYIGALASGSYVAITHAYDPADGSPASQRAQAIRQQFRGGAGRGRAFTRAQIEALFDGLDLLEPGVVPVTEWWPEGPRLTAITEIEGLLLGGVGRKP
jgi:hypothetical protein